MFGQFDITISKSKLEDIKSIYGNNFVELLSDFFTNHNTFNSSELKSLKSFNQKKSSDDIQLKIAGFIPKETWEGILHFCEYQRVSINNFANWALQLIWENDVMGSPVKINSSLKIKPAAKTSSTKESSKNKTNDKDFSHNKAADKYFGK